MCQYGYSIADKWLTRPWCRVPQSTDYSLSHPRIARPPDRSEPCRLDLCKLNISFVSHLESKRVEFTSNDVHSQIPGISSFPLICIDDDGSSLSHSNLNLVDPGRTINCAIINLHHVERVAINRDSEHTYNTSAEYPRLREVWLTERAGIEDSKLDPLSSSHVDLSGKRRVTVRIVILNIIVRAIGSTLISADKAAVDRFRSSQAH